MFAVDFTLDSVVVTILVVAWNNELAMLTAVMADTDILADIGSR
jgi:hypothetical protein